MMAPHSPESKMEATHYRAVQITAKAQFELVERKVTEPPPGFVRIRVEACGICHTDVLTVEGLFPGIRFPRVPGHEVIGRIDALGEGVPDWKVGQRVAVGYLGGPCFRCEPCRRGDFVNCLNQSITGVSYDGGYAEVMFAREHALSKVPDELSTTEAAPLICAGLTTFNALRHSCACAGDLVAVQGIGGLGHLGIQYARAMGFRVVAIARGAEKAPVARSLGAHFYIDAEAEDTVNRLQRLGGAKLMLATGTSGHSMANLLSGLAQRGEMIVLGVGNDPIDVPTAALVLASRSLHGCLTGTAIDGEDTFAFSVLENVRPLVEAVPLEKAAAAYSRMLSGKARFRMVLVTGQ
jgi:alcohol dehydrogenase, propanol-preferring